jgi:sugar phosphate isomerase/epimerase
MGKIFLGVNMEFVRHHDKPFAWGVEKAAEIGYEYIEPMVHLGRELLSEARYFHSVSMYDDPRWVRDLCDKHNIKLSGLSSHTPLCKPEISVEYLKQAVGGPQMRVRRWSIPTKAPSQSGRPKRWTMP